MLKGQGCAGRKANGQPCRAPRVHDGDYCLMHSPEYAADAAEARRLGGLRRRREVAVSGAYEFNGLATVADIRRLLEVAALDTLGLENSIARARTLGYLGLAAAKLLETGELEQRIAVLEAAVQGQAALPAPVFDADPAEEGFFEEVAS